MSDVEWKERVNFLRELENVPAARANAELLQEAALQWAGRLVPRTSMHDLLFTRIGDDYPFDAEVRVHYADGVFEFTLLRRGLLVTADRSHRELSGQVLNAFLLQLVG
jgi:hypothetical protein